MRDDHDGGLARDFALLTRRGMLGGLALFSIAGAAGAACVADPRETAGPFPADGTNRRAGQVVNALTQSGVMRQDIRGSFGGLSGVAEGVPVALEIALVDVAGCGPLAGHAIYLWHADAEGRYSLYDMPGQNYLRGVGVSDAAGLVRFVTVLPGCYDGRWPHIHFEVFPSLANAASGRESLLISQFALPETVCAKIYAEDARYAASLDNLQRISIASDNVFRDNSAEEIAVQTPVFAGDASGLSAKVTVAVAV